MVRYSGVLGVEEPHQSIPNLVVKLCCGDDTIGEVLRKYIYSDGSKNFKLQGLCSYIIIAIYVFCILKI
ncbi:hypothetical protein L6164_026090 [Bauhinia variegata]|uniref:Uncharacterized protein n=1 Tax=Bauhinia variegata TaxID=167791 RepID=A0ACB9M307_BAUVA|nr:hypothetical protein L6164_026090 [Bauhinia variegata]